MDFYDADSCRELGLPCPQSQSGTHTPAPARPPAPPRWSSTTTPGNTVNPSQTVTPTAASNNNTTPGTTMHQTTTPRNIDFSTLSPKETCFGEDDESGDTSSQLDQQANVTTLSYVSSHRKIRTIVLAVCCCDYFMLS